MILNKEKNNLSKSFLESVDTGSASEIVVDKEIFITIHQNNTNNLQKFNKEVSKDFIQFHFCLFLTRERRDSTASLETSLAPFCSVLTLL